MDVLRRKRKVVRTAFTRLYNCLYEAVNKSDYVFKDDFDSLAKFEIIREKYEELSMLDNEILDLLLRDENNKQDDIDDEVLTSDEYKSKFKGITLIFQKKLNYIKENEDNYSNSNANKRKFNLPILELKKFSGEIKDWLPFWGQFKKIHDDLEIDEADKFQYLIQATMPNTRAREVVESFPTISENYKKAIDCLKSRFGRDDLLVEYYVRELLKLTLTMNSKEHQVSLPNLYDKIETQLRALESLGVATDKYAAMLFPLVESCLNEDVLRAWQRSSTGKEENISRLDNLMKFLETEVQNEDRITLAMRGFSINNTKNNRLIRKREIPTAAGLFSSNVSSNFKCYFCDNEHETKDCKFALKLKLQERKAILAKKGCCYICLKRGHLSKLCRSKIKCLQCQRKHYVILCPEVKSNDSSSEKSREEKYSKVVENFSALTNPTCSQDVLLQTLIVLLRGKDQDFAVRALIDTGSQRSYISQEAALKMNYEILRNENIVHNLFGCMESYQKHKLYRIYVSSFMKDYHCTFEALSQDRICANIPRSINGHWKQEIQRKGIFLSDQEIQLGDISDEIHLLIGADVAGKLFTGKIENLSSGLVAMETLLGWTIMGKRENDVRHENSLSTILNLHVSDVNIAELWKLDTLGILDPVEKESREEIERRTKEYFLSSIQQDEKGRYVVSLPWIEDHTPLPSYKSLAEKRLKTTISKVKSANILKQYDEVFREWLDDDIIEELDISELDRTNCHYLPHRPVIKENSTTKIRPVFDGSAKMKNYPSLNECLEKGPNLVENIPSILNRFRLRRYGVIADIRKAFLQIRITDHDKDYLRFLWWENGDEEKLKIYRHRRVVFGVTCSPFLLEATLAYHLDKVPKCYEETAAILKKSMYVDNCVTSVESEYKLKKFISDSQEIMSLAKFDLRGWQHNLMSPQDIDLFNNSLINEESETDVRQVKNISVLGLLWNIQNDTLQIDLRGIVDSKIERVTKRNILACCHKIFDPIGFTCPITLVPKLLLQETWKLKINWDEILPEKMERKFQNWRKQLANLDKVRIPRYLCFDDDSQTSLHVFCDASQLAYATCIYLRSENKNGTICQLVAARSRVAPLKSVSIPRLELLACCIGARLAHSIKQDFSFESLSIFYWSDSMNVLYWIKRDEPWATFVFNRVKEIRSLTDATRWNYVPGEMNIADLPSRGCTPAALLVKRWWEGPTWLRDDSKNWPTYEIVPDKNIVNLEKKKTIANLISIIDNNSYYIRISSFIKIVRITAWVIRFIKNLSKINKILVPLTANEIVDAEQVLWKIVQRESFVGNDERLRSFQLMTDSNGILRTKTRLIMRKDNIDFNCPIILPNDHPVVKKLIMQRHQELQHAGVQIMMSKLREHYWILKCRQTIRKVIYSCVRCKRFKAKNIEVEVAPLPEDRVRDAAVFEVSGVDLAGPLYLKDGTKCWIVLFTCAIYRAIHLELVTSLSTDKFLQALRRFISRRGRPKIVYSDNGKNFVGTNAEFKKINWEHILSDHNIRNISWKFIPPSSPWWGGWWERLVGLVKDILRKVLGKASLKYEELYTILCDCEMLINSRPLTYMSEDSEDLEPLTPSKFLQDLKESGVPDIDHIDSKKLQKRILYRMKLKDDLRKRFRNEYLGQLRQNARKIKKNYRINVGDIVIIGSDNLKRFNWPLARVLELYPGKDGLVRVVKLKTKSGELIRSVQRLYPLELNQTDATCIRDCLKMPIKQYDEPSGRNNSDSSSEAQREIGEITTRSGRMVKPIKRLNL